MVSSWNFLRSYQRPCRRGSSPGRGRPSSLKAARDELLARGVEVSDIFHDEGGIHTGSDEPFLLGWRRVNGLDPGRRSNRSFASFRDPDGNGWLFQEITGRLPGRVEGDTTFGGPSHLAAALRRAAAAHDKYEKRIGARDEDRPDWYAEYIVREQAGRELPS